MRASPQIKVTITATYSAAGWSRLIDLELALIESFLALGLNQHNCSSTLGLTLVLSRPSSSFSNRISMAEIYNFLVMESCAPRSTSIRNDNGNLRGQLTLSAAKFVSSSYINLCYCVSAFVGPATATATAIIIIKEPANKGSQKVSGFITCSNSSISLLTTRRHAKVRKICRARHRLWSGLNHRWDFVSQIPDSKTHSCYSVVMYSYFRFRERERERETPATS